MRAMRFSGVRAGVAAALLIAAVFVPGLVRAGDPPAGPANAQVSATAEALFEEGRDLMKAKKYPEACSKLSASLRIDPAIGTMLYLAECYEKNGQTASAWSMFTDAVAAAQQANQAERALKAKLRVEKLVPKLVKLNITLAPENGSIKDIELKRDGVVVGSALFGTAVPVDPGDHTIEVAAPGKKPWSGSVNVPSKAGSVIAFVVPKLEDLPPPPEPTAVPTATATATASVALPPPTATATAVAPTATATSLPPPADTTIRTVGFFVGGVGLAGVAVASALGLTAKANNEEALDKYCDAIYCYDQRGLDLTNQAKSLALGSTIAFIVGGAAVATGLGMIIYPALSGGGDRKAASNKASAEVLLGPGSLSLRGRF